MYQLLIKQVIKRILILIQQKHKMHQLNKNRRVEFQVNIYHFLQVKFANLH